MIKLSIIITNYITNEYLEELDNSLKDIKVPFEIVHISDKPDSYKFKYCKKQRNFYAPKGVLIILKI